jgi:hypothetical protein
MKHVIVSIVLGVGLCGVGQAQSTPPQVAAQQQREIARGEPARWLKDDRGMAAQVATKRKEIGAALNEALNDCRQMAAGERGACIAAARQTYRQDMANVRELVAQSNQMGGVYDTAGPSE